MAYNKNWQLVIDNQRSLDPIYNEQYIALRRWNQQRKHLRGPKPHVPNLTESRARLAKQHQELIAKTTYLPYMGDGHKHTGAFYTDVKPPTAMMKYNEGKPKKKGGRPRNEDRAPKERAKREDYGDARSEKASDESYLVTAEDKRKSTWFEQEEHIWEDDCPF